MLLAWMGAADAGQRRAQRRVTERRVTAPAVMPKPNRVVRKARKAAPRRPAPHRFPKGLYLVEAQGNRVFYRRGYVLKVGVHVVEANLMDPETRIAVMISEGGLGTAESFGKMVRRTRPAAAITGTFFGIKNKVLTGDLVIDGQSIFRGFVGTAVAFRPDNRVDFISTRRGDRSHDWTKYETVIRAGPRLLAGGRIVLAAREEGFRSLPISRRRPRTAVGVTADQRLLLVAARQSITMWELAKIMRALGVRDAAALDGGSSTALYFAGRFLARPQRGLTNLLMVYHRRDNHELARPRLLGPYARPASPAAPPKASPGSEPAPDGGFEPARALEAPAPVEMVRAGERSRRAASVP